MSRGTPHCLKCPRCRRGQWREPRAELGVLSIGNETRVSRSRHSGHGSGGTSFYGYRGIVECLDCGHVWASTHPRSGRVRLRDAEDAAREGNERRSA